VVTVVLLAVTMLAQVDRGTRVPGSAAAEQLPRPPQPGDCLLEKAPVGSGWGYQGQLYPALLVGPCQGPRWGEVISVMAGGLTAATSVNTTDVYGSDVVENPVQTYCTQAQSAYLSGGPPRIGDWHWEMGGVAAVGPTARQRSAGQSWIACVITPDTGSVPTRYSGSVRDVVVDGTLPAVFATCAATVQEVVSELTGQAPALRVSCDRNHRVEILGRNSYLPAITQDQLDHSCAELIRWLTRMSDPTAGGLLATRAVASHPDPITGSPVPGVGGNGAATCIVGPIGDRELRGSLVGLGAGAVPWS